MMKKHFIPGVIAGLLVIMLLLPGCGATSGTTDATDVLVQELEETLTQEPPEAAVEAESNIETAEDAPQDKAEPVELEPTQLLDASELSWSEVEGGISITEYDGEKTAIRIPDTINDLPVVSIDWLAFDSEDSLTVVELPETVTTLGDGAFSYCVNLVSVKMPGVVHIGGNAFEGCWSLREVAFADELHTIERMAFTDCISLTEIDLPDSLTTIGSGAFLGTGLLEVTVPGSVESIPSSTFYSCESLVKVTLEDGITSIGDSAFSAATSLEEAHIPASVTDFGYDIFWEQENLTVYTPVGSAAEEYANQDGIACEAF